MSHRWLSKFLLFDLMLWTRQRDRNERTCRDHAWMAVGLSSLAIGFVRSVHSQRERRIWVTSE